MDTILMRFILIISIWIISCIGNIIWIFYTRTEVHGSDILRCKNLAPIVSTLYLFLRVHGLFYNKIRNAIWKFNNRRFK